MRRDPVTPETALAVYAREGGCLAVKLGEPPSDCSGRLTLDHIREQAGMGKRRAPSDMRHLVAVCEGHSELGAKAGHQWNTANRPAIRAYLEGVAS